MNKKMMMGAAAMLAAGVAQAATITWGAATTVVDETDVSTVGTSLYAESWALGATDVNGVDFVQANVNVSYSGGTQLRTDNVPEALPQTGGYYDILRGIAYSADAGTSISLNNLVVGHTYDVQIWSVDDRYGADQNLWLAGDTAISLSTQDGQYAIGSFKADATSQNINFLEPESGRASGIINAVQVRTTAIPEPATIGLISAFGGGLLFIRRRFII